MIKNVLALKNLLYVINSVSIWWKYLEVAKGMTS